MKKTESDYIIKTYTRYMRALHFMNTELGLLDQIDYKLDVYTLWRSNTKATHAKNIIKEKLDSMIKSRSQLFNECYLLQKMMKKLKIEIPKVMIGFGENKEFRLNKMKWIYNEDRHK